MNPNQKYKLSNYNYQSHKYNKYPNYFLSEIYDHHYQQEHFQKKNNIRKVYKK